LLLTKISNLEGEIADLKDWEAEKEKYELTEIGSGARSDRN